MPQAEFMIESKFSKASKKEVFVKPVSQQEIPIPNNEKGEKVSINLTDELSIIVKENGKDIFKVEMKPLPPDWAALGANVTVGGGTSG